MVIEEIARFNIDTSFVPKRVWHLRPDECLLLSYILSLLFHSSTHYPFTLLQFSLSSHVLSLLLHQWLHKKQKRLWPRRRITAAPPLMKLLLAKTESPLWVVATGAVSLLSLLPPTPSGFLLSMVIYLFFARKNVLFVKYGNAF